MPLLVAGTRRRHGLALSAAFSPQGEWLLLFNSVLPFPGLLSQTAALDHTAPGLHITARTETVRQRGQGQMLHSLFWSEFESKETGQ